MKKSFVKIIAATLIIVTNTLLLNCLYKHTNYWQDENDVKKFKTIPYNVQLANVGSSHGQFAFDYEVAAGYRCANLGLQSQRHNMNYLVLKEYISRMAENAVLLIPISYFEITAVGSNFDESQAAYYRILSHDLIPDYSFLKDIKYNVFPVFSAGGRLNKIIEDDEPNQTVFTRYTSYQSKEKLKETSYPKYQQFVAPTINNGEEGFKSNQHDLAKIIDLCHEHHIKPVLITTPITDVLNEYFDNHEGFFDTFYRFIDTVQAKYPDIPYFDYSHDERFSSDHVLFFDNNHLNTAGAQKFTHIVVSDLENAGLLQKPQSTATNTDFDD